MENKSASEVFLSVKGGNSWASLMDSLGRTWTAGDVTGLGKVYSYDQHVRDKYTRLAPGARQTVVMIFHGREDVYGPLEGGTASFALEMARHLLSNANAGRGEAQYFSVGIANIPMTVAPEPKTAPARTR